MAADNFSFMLQPAYRFVRTIDAAADPAGSVSQIRSEVEIREMDA